jgi:hypothetical protein
MEIVLVVENPPVSENANTESLSNLATESIPTDFLLSTMESRKGLPLETELEPYQNKK